LIGAGSDGNIFDRFFVLGEWIAPEEYDQRRHRYPIKSRNGASLRFFLGPEATYFVFDGRTGEFEHNIQTRHFQAWIKDCSKQLDDKLILKEGLAPHCLALGPNDMFCWICENDFEVNSSFRDVFPSIVKFLEYAKRKKMLSQVVSSPSELLACTPTALTITARCSLPVRITNLVQSSRTSFCRSQTASASAQYPQMRLTWCQSLLQLAMLFEAPSVRRKW